MLRAICYYIVCMLASACTIICALHGHLLPPSLPATLHEVVIIIQLTVNLSVHLSVAAVHQPGRRQTPARFFKAVWAEAMGQDETVPVLTARGVRYGTVQGIGEASPEHQG